MILLTNKTILLISPQSWGKMFLAKHHYAIELAKKGNQVFFLNPPEVREGDQRRIEITALPGIDNLWLINHRIWFTPKLKFHAMPLFHFLMKYHIQKIIKKISRPLDIVWSFDLGNYYPFDYFGPSALKIFHPIDEPLNKTAIDAAKGCNIILSVTSEIVEKYHHVAVPKYVINHGVSDDFLLFVNRVPSSGKAIQVGLSGNLLRSDIDRRTLTDIIRANPAIIFNFFGSYAQHHSNIGGFEDAEVKEFIDALQSAPNVRLHGVVAHQVLAAALHQMDAFLICYDIKKDQSKGTNYHKIMEYLSTGKVVISSNVTTYQHQPDLIQMIDDRENNLQLPHLFESVINNLSFFNRPELQQKRIDFARDNSYPRQIGQIEKLLSNA